MSMYFLYGSVVLLVLIIIYGAWSRKSIYKNVDSLESKKIQIMNEPVIEELSKIKVLKMSGETEERFEQWRKEWDEIVTVQLPDIEEKLFDIEEMVNKYRFNKAKRLAKFIDQELTNIDNHLKEMIQDVEELVNSEEENRKDIHTVKDFYQETKKKMWSQRGLLGSASASVERNLKEMQEMFTSFETETEEGNYLHAREILQEIQVQLESMSEAMDKVPEYLVLLEKDLPSQISELEKGFMEMEEEGYEIEHFSVKFQTAEMKRRILVLLPLVENLKLEDVLEPIQSIQQEMNEIYEKLENEVISRQQVEKELPLLNARVDSLPELYEILCDDIETVKLSYRLSEEEDNIQLKIQRQLRDLRSQYSVILDSVQGKKQSYTSLLKLIQEFEVKLNTIEDDLKESKERLNHLRSDERSAGEAIQELRERLILGHRKLKRSNLPGVPERLIIELDEAAKVLNDASEKLNVLPLSIAEVRTKVDEARKHVESCDELLMKVIEEAKLAEQVIQYGNRFRTKYDELNIRLLQAESYFRQYQYEEALETALTAIEQVDPDVLEKISDKTHLQTTH